MRTATGEGCVLVRGDPSTDRSSGQPRTLAEKLTFLLDRIRRDDGRRYTHAQVAHAVAAATGKPCDRAYISSLCSGAKDNPTMAVLKALAAFFDVSPAFFFDDEHSNRIAEQIELAVALQDGGTRELVLQMLAQMDEKDVGLASDVIRSIVERRSREAPGGEADTSDSS